MVGDNKILTVSYGTFSCTLEGFDEPFSTMKSIAEYFRDLAAEDRFFGAEPPQPDTDYLHRIAEQTVQQRVSARVSENSLVLTQDDGAEPQQPQAPQAEAAPAAQPAPEPAQPAETSAAAAPAAASLAPADVTAPLHVSQADALDDKAELQPSEDSVAAKLQRIRSVVARESIEVSPYSEDEHAADVRADHAEDLSEDDEFADEQLEALESEAAPEIDLSGLTFDDETAEDDVEEASGSGRDPAAEPVAARAPITVQRISREELIAAQSEDAADESEAALSEEDEAALQRELSAIEEDSAEQEPVDDGLDSSEQYSEFARNFLDDEESSEGRFDFLPSELETETEVAADSAEVEEVAEAEAEAEPAPAMDDPEDDMHEADESARAARLARREGMIEDEDAALERLMSATSSRLEDSESSVRRASIAHLKAAVAATKADASIVEDTAAKEEAEKDPYRADLARVVNQPPQADAAPAEDPKGPSPLVLVSGQRVEDTDPAEPSDDETDSAEAAESPEPAGETVATDDDGNIFAEGEMEPFSAYATRYNALELPDLLEAAAGHYTHVEGVAQFTRPMLMRKISAIAPEHSVSREDGLRSFGTLLREGKIVKGKDGKFVIASTSRFTQEARIAGE